PRAVPASDKPKGGKEASRLAKRKFLELRRTRDITVDEALRRIGYSTGNLGIYKYWRRTDPEFRKAADRVRAMRNRDAKAEVPDFPEFCEKYLGWRLHRHQLQWYDILEGREPRELHESQTYEPGLPTHIVINTPPEHAKTSTITVAWVLWRILRDPDELVLLVSKNRDMAADYLSQIKDFLTNPAYEELQYDFAPEDGFQKACTEWSTYRIRFGPKLRTKSAKDPTVQAIGIRGLIYGKRATIAVLDDCIDTENAPDVDKQFNWLTRMVLTRLGYMGTCLLVGSRVDAIDLYKEVRNPQRYSGGEVDWTYFGQPAVEEFAENPEDWKTLWPRSNMPQVGDNTPPDEDGTYPMWDGPRLRARRAIISANAWAQGYQQLDIDEDSTFPREAVHGCINGMRKVGLLTPQTIGGPKYGMAGMYVVAGLDPAASGYTAMVVIALDRMTGKRWVLDVSNTPGMTPEAMRRKIKELTEFYGVHEWRVERNSFQTFLTRDTDLNRYMANRGVMFIEHTTGRNKLDPDFGVASMSGLFNGWQDGENLIELPSTQNEGVRALTDQLIAWKPETRNPTDTVMALWFAEIRCRELVDTIDSVTHLHSNWMSSSQKEAQRVIDFSRLDMEDDDQPDVQMHSWWSARR
ncbi:MAG: hypothetical protein ACOC5M_01795, partial [Chloroflexota bacterium]